MADFFNAVHRCSLRDISIKDIPICIFCGCILGCELASRYFNLRSPALAFVDGIVAVDHHASVCIFCLFNSAL